MNVKKAQFLIYIKKANVFIELVKFGNTCKKSFKLFRTECCL